MASAEVHAYNYRSLSAAQAAKSTMFNRVLNQSRKFLSKRPAAAAFSSSVVPGCFLGIFYVGGFLILVAKQTFIQRFFVS
jgi:hypothetical protein